MIDHIEDHKNADYPGKKLSEDIAHALANKNDKNMRILFSKMSPRKPNQDLILDDVLEQNPKNISNTPDPVLLSNQGQDGDEEEKKEKNKKGFNDKLSPQFIL